MSKRALTLAATLLFSLSLLAQKTAKWGDIPPEDLRMTVYPGDSAATAVVLQDVGKLEYIETPDGLILLYSQHRRIKVFDQSAFKEGNLFIPYYSRRQLEKIRELDVQVIAPDGSKTKVKGDNIFTEKLSKSWSAKKVFVPNLQKGSIIEYRITIETEDWLTMRTWFFQDPDLPTRWSEFTVNAPEFFNYVSIVNNINTFDLNENRDDQDYYKGTDEKYVRNVRRMGLKNVPALKNEPFVTTVDDYRANVRFQLRSINPKDKVPIKIMTSWSQLAEELEKDPHFGQQYLRKGNSDRLWAAFSASAGPLEGLSPEALAAKVIAFVSANIHWNGNHNMLTDSDLDKVFERKSGSTAEINLAVVALLQRAGVPAQPILLSTRDNGSCLPEYPMLYQFNTVCAYLAGSGDPETGMLLDASSPQHPVGLAREETYNLGGWVAENGKPRWVAVKAPESTEVYLAQLALSPDGTMSGHVTLQLNGQVACSFREALLEAPKGEFLLKRFTDKYPDATLDSLVVEHAAELNQPVKASFSVRLPHAAQVANDFLYCAPIADFFFEENPFKTLTRTYPVNFPYPVRAQFVLNLQLPPGYKLDETPPALNLSLPNDGGKLSFSSSLKPDGELQATLRLSLKQLDFQPDEYAGLRLFFDKIDSKLDEQVVLKKI